MSKYSHIVITGVTCGLGQAMVSKFADLGHTVIDWPYQEYDKPTFGRIWWSLV